MLAALVLSAALLASDPAAAGGPRDAHAPPPPCVADVCQPRVAVPGFEQRLERPSRTQLVAVALDRVHVEPFATLAWALAATGLRLDYTPPALEGPSQAPTRWGTLFLRVRFRVDAVNHPVLPHRGAPRPR